jgi:hypothetical protein
MRAVISSRVFRPMEYRWKTTLLAAIPIRDPMVMVTGADRTHFKSLCNLMRSAAKWEPEMRCIVYDLGFEPDQREEFAAAFPFPVVRRFDFSRFPPYFDIRVKAGEFAWKPVIFSAVFQECRCSVLWFDAGNVLTGPLTLLRKVVQWKGFYSPYAKPHIASWTHPDTLKFLKTERWIYTKTNLTGGCVAASYRSSKARKLVERWRECAMIQECIAPPGSNRYNHRQDMSVLSILAYQLGMPLFLSNFLLGFKCQQDVD